MGLTKKKLLFVTWDSDKSNYLESLFFPILKGLGEAVGLEAHVLQFSWAKPQEVHRIQQLAASMGIFYSQFPIHRRPLAGLGALWTVYQGIRIIRDYVRAQEIDVLMPRSTMPAMMVNRLWDWLKREKVTVVFDADGLPLEERVDFAGLKTKSYQYRKLKAEETKMIKRANLVLSRSQASIDIHLKNIGEQYQPKFLKVANGRDADFFQLDPKSRKQVRESLGLAEGEMLWVYTGSLGIPYEVDRMLSLFGRFHAKHPKSKFLILTRQRDFLQGKIPNGLSEAIVVRSGSFQEIPKYLSAGDVGLSLRKFAPSLAGLAPIKLGEYLLMGLPVIASRGVGDTEQQIGSKEFAFFLDPENEEACLEWLEGIKDLDPVKIREFALAEYSLERAVRDYLEIWT